MIILYLENWQKFEGLLLLSAGGHMDNLIWLMSLLIGIAFLEYHGQSFKYVPLSFSEMYYYRNTGTMHKNTQWCSLKHYL